MAAIQQVGLRAVVLGMSDFNRGTSIIRKQMGLTGAATRRAAKDSRQFGSSLNQVGSNIRNFGNQVLILGFQLTFLASGAMVAVINAAAQFEKEMTKINTLVGVSAEQVGEWGEQLLELAPALGQTPRALAEGLFFITSAGIRDATESMDVLEISAKAAAIGMGDVKDVANAVTSVMQAYASTGITAAEATDILTATVREGKTQAEELAPSIGRVIPLASQMGVSFQEVGAFVATFTRRGVPAAVAVTSLRSALTAILKPSSKAKEELAEYGLTMDNVRHTIEEEGLAQALIQLSVILNDDDEAFGNVIGSARGLTGVLAVTGDLTEDYKNILDNLNNSAGITAEGFETVSKTTAFMADQAKASAEVVANSFGQILLPGINAVLTVLTNLLLSISGFAEANPNLVKAIGAIAAVVTVLGPLLIVTGLVISSVGTLITAIGALGGVVAAVLSPIGLLVAAFSAAGIALGGSLALGFKELIQRQEESGEQLAWRAFFWGEALISSFAQGMAAAASAIIDVLIDIGNTIAFWLEAFSPPRLLPNIDKWGTATMQAWVDGFAKVDFRIFNQISDRLEGFIRSLNIADVDVVPEIQDMRKALLQVVKLFSQTGQISQSAIKKVTDSIGKSNAVLKEYVKTFLELENATRAVAEAQEQLNEINERFDDLLKPINKELKEIDDIRQDELDLLRQEELQAIIKDPRAPQRVKELAQLELKQIALKKEKRTLEDARSLELEAANEKLTLAQKEQDALTQKLDLLDAIISAQQKDNELIREQIDLLEQLAKKAKSGAGDFAGRPGGIGIGGKDGEGIVEGALTEAEQRLKDLLDPPPPKVATLAEKIEFAMRRLTEKIREPFEEVIAKIPDLSTAWADAIEGGLALLESDSAFIGRVSILLALVFTKTIKEALKLTGRGIGAGISGVLSDPATFSQFAATSSGGPAVIIAGAIARSIFTAQFFQDLKSTFENLASQEEGGFGQSFASFILDSIEEGVTGEGALSDLSGIANAMIDRMETGLIEGINSLNEDLFPVAEELRTELRTALEGAFSEENRAKVSTFFSNLGEKAGEALISIEDLIGGDGFSKSNAGLSGLGGFTIALGPIVLDFINNSIEPFKARLGELKDSFHNLALKIQNFFLRKLEAAETFMREDVLGTIKDLIATLFGEEGSLGNTILKLITQVFNPFETALDNVKEAAGNLLTKMKNILNLIKTGDWSIPWPWEEGSPSPFSQAMMNASAATDMLIDSMNMLQTTGSDVTQGMQAGSNMTRTPMRGGGGNSTTNTVNFGGQSIGNNMDMAEFIILVQQTIRNEL
jgi:TP901 family phage tail tape measure protein